MGKSLFNSPNQTAQRTNGAEEITPPDAIPRMHTTGPQPNVQLPQTPYQFRTPPGQYNNPMANVMAATHYLTSLPILGNSPEDQVARQAVDWLKTVVTQQAQYSQGHSNLQGTPRPSPSISRHVDSPASVQSSSHRNQGGPSDTSQTYL